MQNITFSWMRVSLILAPLAVGACQNTNAPQPTPEVYVPVKNSPDLEAILKWLEPRGPAECGLMRSAGGNLERVVRIDKEIMNDPKCRPFLKYDRYDGPR